MSNTFGPLTILSKAAFLSNERNRKRLLIKLLALLINAKDGKLLLNDEMWNSTGFRNALKALIKKGIVSIYSENESIFCRINELWLDPFAGRLFNRIAGSEERGQKFALDVYLAVRGKRMTLVEAIKIIHGEINDASPSAIENSFALLKGAGIIKDDEGSYYVVEEWLPRI